MQWLAHTETHRYYRYKYIWRYMEVYMCGDRHVIESKHGLLISIFSEWHLENPLLAMLKPKLWLPGANPSRIRIPIPIRGHRLAKWTALRLVQT